MSRLRYSGILPVAALFVFWAAAGAAQTGAAGTVKGTVERIKVHGKSLEGNLSGDPATRDVSIYLPPSYQQSKNRRYPVIYYLHGFTDSDDKWYGLTKHWINLPEVIDKTLAGGGSKEFIVVTPNAFTAYQGSMYSNSVTTGNWEAFVAKELVAWMDSHYRTIPRASSRGLAGHSMGGYGALRIGMKNAGVFSSLYLLSPCCLIPAADPQRMAPLAEKLAAIQSPADVAKADFFTKAMLASAAAWSPNPQNPPMYLDLPWKDGAYQPAVMARWTANAPLAMLDQYQAELKKFKAIALDAGTKDRPIADTVKDLHEALNRYGISHQYEIYEGDHLNRIAERIEKQMLPFFSAQLETAPPRR